MKANSIKKIRAFARATSNQGFKQMLSLSMGSNPNILRNLLYCFMPTFEKDPVIDITEKSPSTNLLKCAGDKQSLMRFQTLSESGEYCIIEIHASYMSFDKRELLYHACEVYSTQQNISVITLHILDDKDQNIHADSIFSDQPLLPEHFSQDFCLESRCGDKIDQLHIVTVNLPGAETEASTFPPLPQFGMMDWWVSVLRHSHEYTPDQVAKFYNGGKGIMPDEIYQALMRLDLQQWSAEQRQDYRADYPELEAVVSPTTSTEYMDGLNVGKEEGARNKTREIVTEMRALNYEDANIARIVKLSLKELQELMQEQG